MPVYEYQGQFYELSEADPAAAKRKILAHLGKLPKPESGFLPALRAGATELGGGIAALAGKLGLKDEAAAQAAYDAAQQRAKEIFAPTEAGWTEAPGTKFLELLGGSVPYMAAPLAAGAAAAALPITGPAAAVTALGAAGLTSAAQFTATNLSRQMEENKKLADTELGKAALAAIPQAALDTLSMRMIPGIGRLFGQAGVKVTAETAKEIAEQGLKKTLIDYTAATGKTMGAEGLTEAAQQVLERAQAGLSLTDPKARGEYLDSLIGGAVLGGTLAVPGRYVERGREQGEARTLLEGEAAKQREAARKAAEAEKQSPEYLETRYDAYQKLLAEKNALDAQIKKGTKEAPLTQEDKDANAVLNRQLAALKKPLEDARQDFISAGGPQAMAKLRAGQLELTPPPGRVSEPVAEEAAPEAPAEARPRYEREVRGLTDTLEQQRQQMKAAETTEDAIRIAEQAQKTKTALDTAQSELSKLPAPVAAPQAEELQAEVKKIEKKLAAAKEKGDQDEVLKYGKALLDVQQRLSTLEQAAQQDLFAPAAIEAEQRRRDALGEEMAAGREAAAYERQQQQIEQETAREEAARRASVDEAFAAEGTAEREAMSELGQRLAQAQRGREMERVRTAPQLELFPEPLERVEQTTTKEGGFERRTVRMPPEAPQVGTRPAPRLTAQVATLTDRVLAAPNVAEDTKDVVRQIQADVPGFLRAATTQTVQAVREQERRAAAQNAGTPAESTTASTALFNPSQVAAWLYRTLTTGRADPADTARALQVLRAMQETPAAVGQQRLATIRPEPMRAAMARAQEARAAAKKAAASSKRETSRAEREAADAAKRRAEQASLEAGERAGVMVFFDKNKEDIMADTNYIKLVEQTYDPSLSSQERMQAATEADKYMQEKQAKLEARAEKTSAASVLHEENLKNARAKLDEMKALRGKKRAEKTAAKLEDAIKKQEAVIAGHQAKLNKALTGTKVTRMSRADLKAVRDQANDEILRTRVAGERLGVAEGTQQRAIGPATRAEVIPPRTLRTGSEESVAGETTTPPKNRIQEARGVKQRDVAMNADEIAEANRIAAEFKTIENVEKAEKALAQEFKAAKERGLKDEDLERFRDRQDVLTKRKAELRELKALLPLQKATEETAAVTPKKGKRKAANEVKSTKAEREQEIEDLYAIEEAFEPEILGGTREEAFLSRGPTATPSTTDSARTELKKVFPDLGRVQIYDSVDALIAANPQYKGKIPADARGFVDSAGNKAFLIAENINQGQALSVLLHEVGAHVGLKSMLGDAQYNALVKAVETWSKRNDGSTEARVAQAAQARVEAAETPAAQRQDELLAYAVEEAVNAGVKPMETKGPLGQWLSRVAAAFRRALEKFGLPPKALDAQGLVDMAFGAAKMEMREQTAPAAEARTELGELLFSLDEEKTLSTPFALDTWYALGKIGPINNAYAYVYKEAPKNGEKWVSLRLYDGDLIAAGVKPAKAEVEDIQLSIDAGGKKASIDTFGLPGSASAAYSKYRDNLIKAANYNKFKPGSFSTKDVRGLIRIVRDVAVREGLFANVENVRIKRATGATAGTPPRFIEREAALKFSRNLPVASRVANQIVGEQKGWLSRLKDNFLGLGGRAQFVDKLAPTEEAFKRINADPKKALQAMYYLRMYDQRMHFTSQAITEGVPERVEKTRRDGTKEFLIEAKPGANLKKAFDILARKDVVKEAGSADAANKLVTLYMAAIRGERVGYDKLNFGDKLKPADIKAAKAEIDANPVLRDAFNDVRDIYNQYNRDLLNFNVQSGSISKETANKLLQQNDYIPYYRMRDGVAELIIGGETPIRIGNLKDSPHLKELVGGDEPIVDFIASSIQNTSMLIDMATHNLAMRNLMFEFKDVGLATVGKVKGGKTPEGAVTFKLDGVEHFGVVDTEALGISSDLLVKGLAGIPTMFPAFVRVMGMPARLLRRVVVASPLYMARQLFRDSLAASIASGANTVPVLDALKQIGKPNALERRGITGGQVFTGMPEDMANMVKAMQAGKFSVTNGLSYLEAKAAQVDALTRRSQYESYLKQGLSEMEATYMALESMNFSRRGLSPSMHMASTLIPFFNAQIQGLDVLYRSFTGQMPMNERLEIRKKLLERGLLMFGLSMAYAMAMQDDEAYKNAKPEEKYGNWFVNIPGVEQPIRLPIPFELGYVFKALPEAIVNTLVNEKGGEEAVKALKHIVQQMIPGGSSFMIPQAAKPALEALAFEKSLYTGRDIESAREQQFEPGYRARESTTALAKAVGEMTGFSPIKLEYLINGYTGQLGMAALAALSAPFGGAEEGPKPATKRLSDLPVVGTMFQPTDASGIIDLVYERMNKVRQVQATYKELINQGKPKEAEQYAKEKADDLALASVAGQFRQQMGEITDFERQVRASTLSPDRKRQELDRARQAKIRLAQAAQAVAGRRTPQAALAE